MKNYNLQFFELGNIKPVIEDNAYCTSKPLLCKTIYGSLIVCHARYNFMGVLEFHTGFSDRPYSYREITSFAYADKLLED